MISRKDNWDADIEELAHIFCTDLNNTEGMTRSLSALACMWKMLDRLSGSSFEGFLGRDILLILPTLQNEITPREKSGRGESLETPRSRPPSA